MQLNQFTPAQVLMLTSPKGVTGKSLIKYSFLDLIYKGVLTIYKDWRLPHPRSPRERLYTLAARGKSFDRYTTSLHQQPFMEIFLKGDYEVQVRTLLKKIFKEVKKGPGFKSDFVYKELKEVGYFSSSLGLKHLNLFFLSEKGAKLKKKFSAELEVADSLLPKYSKTNKERTKQLLNTLGSNVLLLDCFNDELIEELKPMFTELGRELSTFSDAALVQEDAFELLFYSFIDTLDHFDASFDSFDSNFDFSDYSGADFGGGDFGDMDLDW